MRNSRLVQLTKWVGVAGAAVFATGGALGSVPYRPAIDGRDTAQDWKWMMLVAIDHLRKFLGCQEPLPEDIATAVRVVHECFTAGGIPSDADPAEGRAIIEKTYLAILADPGVLTLVERTGFLLDLTQMYIELGGNPLDLGH